MSATFTALVRWVDDKRELDLVAADPAPLVPVVPSGAVPFPVTIEDHDLVRAVAERMADQGVSRLEVGHWTEGEGWRDWNWPTPPRDPDWPEIRLWPPPTR